MKTERQIIDELGEWLCTDMETSLAKAEEQDGYRKGTMSTYNGAIMDNIRDVAKRIKYYRDNCIDKVKAEE